MPASAKRAASAIRLCGVSCSSRSARPIHSPRKPEWCEDHPAYTLWQRQREQLQWDAHLPWHGEGALLTRPRDAVQWAPLTHAGCALLDACAAGATFEDAAAQALQADPAADLPALVALLLHRGALHAPETSLNY